jgi:hypothetical protein
VEGWCVLGAERYRKHAVATQIRDNAAVSLEGGLGISLGSLFPDKEGEGAFQFRRMGRSVLPQKVCGSSTREKARRS